MKRLSLATIPVLLVAAGVAHGQPAGGNPAAGHADFSACQACHSPVAGKNGVGPSLAGVVGRQAGTGSGYRYSAAMKAAHITWDSASLDRFLSNPQTVVHGTKMFLSVGNATTRRDIIAYLATLK